MKIIEYPNRSAWEDLAKRPVYDRKDLAEKVDQILEKVRIGGDRALKKFTMNFDGVEIEELRVTPAEITNAEKYVSAELKNAISKAKKNIKSFHKASAPVPSRVITSTGVECWRKPVAIEKVGLYIPGGTAPLFSTVLMLALPAKIAGCSEINLCTPPDLNGNINPIILYTAKECGVSNIFKIGGAQAIAAMAFGTESISPSSKIFGPGNQFVTMAKQLVNMEGVAIDMPAGPSEVLVIADKSANPVFVAADLLSQAEHGIDSQVICLTDDPELPGKIMDEIDSQLELLPRKSIAEQALKNSKIIVLKSISEAIGFSNLYAPEHLIINCDNDGELEDKIINAGSVFMGPHTPESAGDYASGTNHTLPTNGAARSYSGLSVSDFMKQITFQRISEDGLKDLGPSIEIMAGEEHLIGHKNAVTYRLNSLNNE